MIKAYDQFITNSFLCDNIHIIISLIISISSARRTRCEVAATSVVIMVTLGTTAGAQS